MKYYLGKNIKTFLPILLTSGIIIGSSLIRIDTFKQISADNNRVPFEARVKQSQLSPSHISKRYEILKDYATNIDTDGRTGNFCSTESMVALSENGKSEFESNLVGNTYSYNVSPLAMNESLPNSTEDSISTIQKLILLLTVVVLLSITLLMILISSRRKGKREILQDRTKLDEAISRDSLTGLFNKYGFEVEAKKCLEELSEECACAIVSFEIVSFRSYNALYGFEAGDALLKKIAEITRNIGVETAGRFYADHFVLFICGRDNEEIFSTIRRGVAIAKETSLPFFLCGGIRIVDKRDMPIQLMIDQASIAKDTIKYKFGTGISIYSGSMLECQLEDAEMIGSMMNGLKNGEFIDYYQPKYNMDSETIAGVEALVRWKKPDGEIIKPGRFIELFEKNGFIRRLDFNTFENACIMLKDSIDGDRPLVPVSVNFSRVHLYDSHFPQRIYNIAKKHGVDTKFLEIELTESAFLMEGEELRKVVDRLHEFGFTVAIDDFGSGFSSLNMLKDVPVDVLKIDMKFLEGFERGGKVGTVVTSVIRMAKWLGIPIVAEGVETKEQIDFLRTLGCDMVQGFFYSPPVSRKEYEEMRDGKRKFEYEKSEKPATFSQDSINAIMGGDSIVNSIIDGIFGAFGLYELSESRIEAIRVNNAYCELLGYPDMQSFRMHSLNVLTRIYPPDSNDFLDTCFKAVRTGNVQKFTIRRYDYFGSIKRLTGMIKYIGGPMEKALICITFIDAAKKIHADREKELNKYADALTGIFDEIWELDYTMNTVSLISTNHERKRGKVHRLNETEQTLLKKTFPEDRGKVEKIMRSVRADKLAIPTIFEYRQYINGEIRWISTSIVSVAGGAYLLCNLDVTDKKQLELLVEKIESINNKTELGNA